MTGRLCFTNEHHYHTNDKDKEESEETNSGGQVRECRSCANDKDKEEGEETNGDTELHRAVLAADIKEVERLIDAGADVNARDNDGNTPLHLAAREGYCARVSYLMKSGKVKKYLTNNQGKTALQLAEEHGNTTCALYIRRG